MSVQPRCPKCGQIGKSVEGIHSAGLSREKQNYRDYDDYPRTRDIHAQTELSNRLSPPPPPRHWNSYTVSQYVIGYAWLAFMVGTLVLTVHSFLVEPKRIPLAIVACAISLAYIVFAQVRYNQRKAVYERELYPKWAEAKHRWHELYYCDVDNGVFFSGQNRFAPLSQILEFLYWGL